MLPHLRWAKGCIDTQLVRGTRRKAEGSKAEHPRSDKVLLERSLPPTRELSAQQTTRLRLTRPFPRPRPCQFRNRPGHVLQGEPRAGARPIFPAHAHIRRRSLKEKKQKNAGCQRVLALGTSTILRPCGQEAVVQFAACAYLITNNLRCSQPLRGSHSLTVAWPKH